MTYRPGQPPVPRLISTVGPYAYQIPALMTASPAQTTYESANLAVYMPVQLPFTCVARRVWWANGASGVAGDASVGIYRASSDGEPTTLVVECASTAQSGTSSVQFADITDTTLPPGLYFIAFAASSASGYYWRNYAATTTEDARIRFQQAGVTVGALPATATPVESTNYHMWICGFATTASP